MENLRMFDPITGKALITDSEYNIGAILIDSEGHPFLHDGRKVGDRYGCLIGYSNGVLCRANGIDSFLKKATMLAPMQAEQFLLCEIRHVDDIPFFKR